MSCQLTDKVYRTIRKAVEIVERYEDVLGKASPSTEKDENAKKDGK